MVSAAPDQLILDLPHRPALGAEDFLISRSNQAAADIVDRWPQWPNPAVAVVGPAHSGKTHLANVWRLKSGAARLEARALGEADVVAASATGAVLVEDLHLGVADQQALFHLLNLVREHKLSLLVTSRSPPGELDFSLPDLRSRLRALPVVTIEPPDAALLKAVLVKHFTDRQLAVEPHTIGYIALRLEQSMEAAAAVVAEIDRAALASHRKVTRALAAEALARLQNGGSSDSLSPPAGRDQS
jgi:chromosomal replication initiation ATPase DnaA